MIIKFNLVRLCIISLLVILFPLVQNQWLNLYLFDKNNFSIYKFLYLISGLLVPILVCFTSLNNFTFYKFSNNITKNNKYLSGKPLFITTIIALFTLSGLIVSFIFINFKISFNSLISENNYLIIFDINKYIFFSFIISILLLFKKIKLIIKKIVLLNFLIISLVLWYTKLNNTLFIDAFIFNNFLKFENIEFLSIFILLFIEILYYLWSYISNGSNLSDWKIPFPNKLDYSYFFNIIYFYLLIIFYYSRISN